MKYILFLLAFCLPVLAREPIPVVVVGSGPAGLSAALVTGRERVETHIYLGDRAGGPLNTVTCLSNWPGSVKGKGHVVMERLFEQLERYPVNQHKEAITGVDFSSRPFRLTTSSGETVEAKTVIIATGAIPRRLDVPGEGNLPTYYCVYKTDKDRFSGQTVAIVGGGIDASKKARILSNSAKKVYLIVRKDKMQLPYMEKQKKNVEILFNTEVKKVEKGALILSDGGQLEVDALVLAMGIKPNTALFKGQLALDKEGYIKLEGRTQVTSVAGVFAAGNVADDRYRQGAISAAEGMKAGYDAVAFLRETLNNSFTSSSAKKSSEN